jgi:hypothetical protein
VREVDERFARPQHLLQLLARNYASRPLDQHPEHLERLRAQLQPGPMLEEFPRPGM